MNLPSLINVERYSKLNYSLQVTAYVLKFHEKFKAVKLLMSQIILFFWQIILQIILADNFSSTAANFIVIQRLLSIDPGFNVADFHVSRNMSAKKERGHSKSTYAL